MMKNKLLGILGITLVAIHAAGAVAEKKPNILFIIADDQSWETVATMSDTEVITPNLDRLVENGVSFRHAYNMGSWSGAVCVASRHMFNTGRDLWSSARLIPQSKKRGKKHKKATAKPPISDLGKSWSQLLGSAGYKTYFSGKWHVELFEPEEIFDVVGTVRPGMPKQTAAGYGRPKNKEDYEAGWKPWEKSYGGFWKGGQHWSERLRDEAVGFIEQAVGESDPFFMYIAFNAPHDPRQAPKEYVDMYPLDGIKVPENFQPNYPYARKIGCPPNKLRDERLMPSPRTEYAVKVNRQEYYACVTHMDAQIGTILDALEKSGKLDNTYIFYTADHGLAVGHHGLVGKQNMYEHSICAPLIVNGPGLEKGKRVSGRVYIQDIVPSTLELAEVAEPETMDFDSLMPLARGESEEGREVIYGAYKNKQRCAIKGGWKLIHYPTAKKYRLYNIAEDADEMNDLVENPEYAEKLEEMKRVLKEEMKSKSDPLSKGAD